jgi:hypothetical protein
MNTTDNTAIAIVVPEREQLPPSLLSNIEAGFRPAFEQAEKWRVQALAIQVTSAGQTVEMKQARLLRLELKNTRVAADKVRKNLKADALLMGRAIDGVYNLLEAAIVPLERHLEEQEKYAERLAEAERQATLARRTSELAPYLTEGQQVPALDVMSAEQFANFLTDAKLLHEAKIEQARKAEADRIAREQAEAAERERLRIENERLRKEAVEREAAAKAEREAFEKSQREAAAQARKEQEAAAAKAKAELEAFEAEQRAIREESERAIAAERAEAAERQRIADEAARKERAAIQAKADAERKAAQAAADAERIAREKLEAELAAKNAAEAARLKAELAAKAKASRAPDKQKALTFAATVRTLKTPEATTTEGKAVMAEIAQKVENFAKWIETQASAL